MALLLQPLHNVTTILIRKIAEPIGRLNGFWKLFAFSMNGNVLKPKGTAAKENTPSKLFGITLNNECWKKIPFR